MRKPLHSNDIATKEFHLHYAGRLQSTCTSIAPLKYPIKDETDILHDLEAFYQEITCCYRITII